MVPFRDDQDTVAWCVYAATMRQLYVGYGAVTAATGAPEHVVLRCPEGLA